MKSYEISYNILWNILWNITWNPMEEHPMKCMEYPRGTIWNPLEYPVEYLMESHGISYEFLWNILWNPVGYSMEYSMKSYGISYGIFHGIPPGTLWNVI